MLLSSPTASPKPTYSTSPPAPRVLTKQVAQGGASCSKQALALWELQGWSLPFGAPQVLGRETLLELRVRREGSGPRLPPPRSQP